MNDAKSKYRGATTLAGVSVAVAMGIRHPTIRIVAWILAGLISLLALTVMVHTYDRYAQLTQKKSLCYCLWIDALTGALILLALLLPKNIHSAWRAVLYGLIIIVVLRLPLQKRKEQNNAPDSQGQQKRRTK